MRSQFAGIFWAKEHGSYEAKGLDVNVVPWLDDGRTVIDKVLESSSNGDVCAGCAEDNLAGHQFADDGSVKVLGAMLHDTPLVVMSRPVHAIRSVADLRQLVRDQRRSLERLVPLVEGQLPREQSARSRSSNGDATLKPISSLA